MKKILLAAALLIFHLIVFGQSGETEPNDTYETANELLENDVRSATLGNGDLTDFHLLSFEQDANLFIILQITNTGSNGPQTLAASVYNSLIDNGELVSGIYFINYPVEQGETVYDTIKLCGKMADEFYLKPAISRHDTTLILPPNIYYCFFVLATDRVGNREALRPGVNQCVYIGSPVPVTWLYFMGKTVAKDNILEWATTHEVNSLHFDVERSLNGIDFNRVGMVNAAGNNGAANNLYQFTDHDIDRLNSEYMFYRLKQVDMGGHFTYSNVVRLRYNEKNIAHTLVYPNPTAGVISMLVGDASLIGTYAALYDVNGRLLENFKIDSNNQQVDLRKYVNGVYLIKLSNREVIKIIKQ